MSELPEVVQRWANHRESAERLRLEQRHSEDMAAKLEPSVVAEVAHAGGTLEIELHGDAFTITAELKITPLSISSAVKKRLFNTQNGRCAAPRCSTQMELRQFEVDHIVPRSKGGLDIEDNLQLLCGWCNRVKGDRDMAYLEERLVEEERASV